MNGVKDQVEFIFKVNGETLPPSTNLFNSVKIVEMGIGPILPFLELSVRDQRAANVQACQIAEGSIITVAAKRTDGDRLREMEFRAIAPDFVNRQGDGHHNTNWFCMLNHPKYYSQVYHFCKRASSADMIGEIAAHCGLQYKSDPTSDSQIWRNFRRTNAGFAKKICAHGYINESSVMMLAATAEDKTLHYRNIPVLFKQKPVAKFVLGNPGQVMPGGLPTYIVEQDRGTSGAGVTNAEYNYGFDMYSANFEGTDAYNKVKAQKCGSTHLSVNKTVKSEVSLARVQHFPFHDNNDNHKNYYKAPYQNARNLALYSEFIAVLVPVQTVSNLLDLVEVEESYSQLDTRKTLRSGKYIVIGKGRMLAGSHYAEKLLLMRNTTTQIDPKTLLI